MHEVGGALYEAVAGPEPFAELEEAARLDPLVGEISGQVVERLLAAVLTREDDLGTAARPPSEDFVGAGRDRAVGPERDKVHVRDGLPGAGEKDIKQRQRASEPAARELGFHLLGDEEAEIQHRVERALEVAQLIPERAAGQVREVWDLADRLEARKDIGRRVAEEGFGVEKIRPAEHIEHD